MPLSGREQVHDVHIMGNTVKWHEDTLVLKDGSLFTVRGSNLELRGEGWERRMRKGDNPGTDRARVCKFRSREEAIRIAEMVGELVEKDLKP